MMGAHVPTPKQIAIRDCEEASMLVTAPAGCGKTEALALRVAGLIRRGQVQAPSQVLALTFSNRATSNLRGRLIQHLPRASEFERVSVQNFHGLSMRILTAHPNIVGMQDWALNYPAVDVVKNWLANNVPGLNYSQSMAVVQELQRAKQQTIPDEELLERMPQGLPRSFEAWRQAERVLTYDDIPRYASLILQNENVAELYRCRFPFLMLDEYQDMNLQLLSIAQAICPGQITFAGDLGQGIYRFAGAVPEQVHQVAVATTRAQYTLNETHRSSPGVIDAYNRVRPFSMAEPLEVARPADWPSGGIASWVEFEDWDQEAAWIRGMVEYVLAKSPNARVGLLCPNRNRRRRIDEQMSASPYENYAWDSPIHDPESAQYLRDLLASFPEPDRPFEGGVDQAAALLTAPTTWDPAIGQNIADGLVWLANELPHRAPVDLMSSIKVGARDDLITLPGVHQLTGHAGKGLEFDWVVIAGMEEGNMPFYNTGAGAESVDQARLLSVMISRARFGVVFSYSRMYLSTKDKIMEKDRSRYASSLVSLPGRADVERWFTALDWDAVNKLVRR